MYEDGFLGRQNFGTIEGNAYWPRLAEKAEPGLLSG